MIIIDIIAAGCAIWELIGNLAVSYDLYKNQFVEKSKIRQMELQTVGTKYKIFAIRTIVFLISIYGWYAIVSGIIQLL